MSLEYLSTVDSQFAEAVLSGFGIMFGIICVSFISIIFLIVGIVIIVQKKHAEQYEMFKAGNEACKRREKLENREALRKKRLLDVSFVVNKLDLVMVNAQIAVQV